MDFVNFGTFETRSPLLTSDFLVGYKTSGPTEIKTQVKDILDLISDSDAQTLSFNESNKNLTISSGNTVSLSALVDSNVDTGVRALTGNWQSTFATVCALSASWEESADILPTVTNYLSTSFVQISALGVSDRSSNVIVDGSNLRGANINLGTRDAYHVSLRTNNSNRIWILSSGEIGVGTSLAQLQGLSSTANQPKFSVLGNTTLIGNVSAAGELYVNSTTLRTTTTPTVSSVVNGNFSDTTGLTFLGGSWYGGVPAGWQGNNSTYTVREESGNYGANLEQLGLGSGSSSFRQNLGVLPILSDIILTFDFTNTQSWSTGVLNAAIYDGLFNPLAAFQSSNNGYGTYSLIATGVPAGTTIIIGFWYTSGTPALDNVSVSQVTSTTLTVVGGVSASSVITPRLQVQDGVVRFTNLPTLSSNLPVGSVWNNNGVLRIVQ